MGDSIEYCQDCETNVACHLNRGCLRLGGLCPSGAVPCSLSERLEQLVEQWERRTIAADKLTNDAAGAGDWTASIRCKAKAGTIRSMTVELKRAIREANAEPIHGEKDA